MVEVGVCSVIDILNGGDRVAVYSVVDATTVYRTIAAQIAWRERNSRHTIIEERSAYRCHRRRASKISPT